MSAADAESPFERPGFLEQRYAIYRTLLERPVCLVPEAEGPDTAVVCRYEDVSSALRDERLSVNLLRSGRARRAAEELPEDFRPENQNPSMLTVDPPHHTRLRGLVNRAFTPRRVEALEGRIAALAESMAAALPRGRPFDLLAEFAGPLPARVIAELLGVAPGDHERFRAWSDGLVRGLVGSQAGEYGGFRRARDGLRDYLTQTIERRRREPEDDLISDLTRAQDEAKESLTDREILGACELLLVAGHETTSNLIANGTALLAGAPEAHERLRARPDSIPEALEEMLRLESPLQMVGRVAAEELEIGDAVVSAGASVTLVLGAANRDPEAFEDAERFDPARQGNAHLAFGFGAHFCLGAALARLEGRIAFETLLAAASDWRLPEPLVFRPNVAIRGLERLPLVLD